MTGFVFNTVRSIVSAPGSIARLGVLAREGRMPVLLTSPGVRPFVRSIVERFRAQTPVLSQSEIHPRVKLKTVAGV